jgi:hypothetical protein
MTTVVRRGSDGTNESAVTCLTTVVRPWLGRDERISGNVYDDGRETVARTGRTNQR